MSAEWRTEYCDRLEDQRAAVEVAAGEILERGRERHAVQGGYEAWEALHPFPVVMSAREIASARRIAESVSRAMWADASGGEEPLMRACSRAGIASETADLARALQPASTGWWSRIDLMSAGESWRIVEVNVGGGMGGCHIVDLSELQLAREPIAGWLRERNLVCGDPTAAYVEKLRELQQADSSGTVAFVDWPGYLAECEVFLGRFAERLRGFDVPAITCELSDLTFSEGVLRHRDGSPISVVVANYLLEDLALDHRPLEPILQAARHQAVALVMGPHGEIFGSKIGPSDLLARNPAQDLLTSDEIDELRRALPPTRLVQELSPAELEELVTARTAHVLKPMTGSLGRGVVLGSDVTDGAWREQIRAAVAASGNVIVQTLIPPHPWILPWLAENGCLERVEAILQLSVFTLDTRMVGTSARVKPASVPGVMSTLRGAALASLASPELEPSRSR